MIESVRVTVVLVSILVSCYNQLDRITLCLLNLSDGGKY